MKWRNCWEKFLLCIHPKWWHVWIDPGGVPVISSCFMFFLGNTSNEGMKCPVLLIQLTTVTRNPRSANWREGSWHLSFNPNIFMCVCVCVCVCVLYKSDADFVTIVHSCRIIFNGVHYRFVDFKKLSYWFKNETLALESERPSGFLTEICECRCRKFFNHFLPAFSFLMQKWFLIPFFTASWVGKRDMMSAIVKPKNFFSIKRQCLGRSFSASQGRTCFLPSFVFTVSLELFCQCLT